MQISKEVKKECYGVRITVVEKSKEIGRVWLYVLYNNLHKEPYGLLEDVFVDEGQRGKGVGKILVQEAMEEAKKIGCYKLIANARSGKDVVCAWYEKFGFKKHGVEFRIDLI